jgi:hypothetical protein
MSEIEARGIDPNNVFYVNADDSSRGLAEKVRLLEEVGAHMLAPGLKGFKATEFSDKLKQAAEDGSARGTVVIIDTLKKFTNLMDKARSAEFAQVCRAYVMGGGTVIALGHTAKNKNTDGSPRYEGTTDIRDGFDAVYVAELMKAKPGSNERVIRFSQLKSRADSPEVVAYAYSTEAGLAYRDKLASVRPVYPEELDGHSIEDSSINEQEVINDLLGYIFQHGHLGQEKIVKAVVTMSRASRATIRRILDRHTGTDPAKHLWNFRRGDRGVQMYYLLTPASDPE